MPADPLAGLWFLVRTPLVAIGALAMLIAITIATFGDHRSGVIAILSTLLAGLALAVSLWDVLFLVRRRRLYRAGAIQRVMGDSLDSTVVVFLLALLPLSDLLGNDWQTIQSLPRVWIAGAALLIRVIAAVTLRLPWSEPSAKNDPS